MCAAVVHPTGTRHSWPASTAGKLALGLATLQPVVTGLLFLWFALSTTLAAVSSISPDSPSGSPAAGPGMPDLPVSLAVLVMTSGYWLFVLLAVYVYHLIRADRVPANLKPVWVILLFVGNILAMLVYWYAYVWREPAGAGATATGQAAPP